MTWAGFLAGLFSLLTALARPLVLFLAFLQGKRAATSDIEAKQAEKDKELAEDYLKNRTTVRTPDDVHKRMQDGSF